MNLANLYTNLLKNPFDTFIITPNGDLISTKIWTHDRVDILSGSYNPLHDGHRLLYENVVDKFSSIKRLCFELSLNRYNKETLSLEELEKRAKQFRNYAPLVITNSPLFIDKVAVLPFQCHFHIGKDVGDKLWEHYGVGIGGIAAQFYVYPRGNPTKGEVEELKLPYRIPNLTTIKTTKYSFLSSTELRSKIKEEVPSI
jgi:nicotinic acid mononucleotide adenylyltransferase